MALSKSILDQINQDKEDKKNKKSSSNGNSSDKSSADAQLGDTGSTEYSISRDTLDKVALDITLKKMGFTHHRDTGLLNDSRYKDYYNTASSVDDTYINRFISDWNSYSNRLKTAYDGMNWKSAQTWGQDKSYEDTGKDIMFRSAVIRSYLDYQKDKLDWSTYKSLTTSLDDIQKAKGEYDAAFSDAKSFYSQWKTEDEYNKWKQETEEYEALKNFDISQGEREVKELEKVLNEYKSLSRTMITDRMQERLDYITANYGDEEGIKALITDKKQYLNRAKHLQEGITLAGVIESDDFKENSGYVSTKDDSTWSKLSSQYGLGYKDLTYEYINGAENGVRDEIKQQYLYYSHGSGDSESIYETNNYDYMTEDQISTYNYYYAKDGKKAAEKYLKSIQETLNYQAATERYEKMEGKTALELLFGIEAGLDQFQSGMKNIFNTEDDYIAQTATQMASGMVREDLADNGAKLPDWLGGASIAQAGYDTITTTANMVPSIMTSTVMNFIAPGSGAAVGSLMMGASAAGNAYQEMLNLGYDKGQARTYSTLVGASEAGLQYLLGGISSLGGKVSGNALTKMLNGIDNAFLRTALQLSGNMMSEGLEEGLQEILTPWLQNLIMHTDEDINWSEVAYSTLLGALTAGVMEGPNTIGDAVSIRNTGKQLQTADISATRLAEIGKTFSADTVAYQIAGRVNENTGAYTMGRLFNEIGATLSEQNVTEITNALVAKGMDQATATKNAKALAYVVEGGQLTDAQVAMIEANEVLAEVARTTLVDANTTWNQRSNALKALADEMAASKTVQTKTAKQSQENTPVANTVGIQNNEAVQSFSGAETVDTSPAKVKTISNIANGQATVKLEDGTEVNAKEADLSVDDGVRIETIARLDGISAPDANFVLNTLRANTSTSAQMDSLGAREAWKYGFYGFSQEHMTTHGVFSNSLTESQRNAIYETARSARQRQVEAKQATVRNNRTVAKSGKVHFEGDHSKLTKRQSASLTAMEKVADVLGVQIYVFESELNERGKRVGANGWYDPKDSSIHIDLHAGENGAGTMLFTLAHELTHHIRQWSPAKFKVLSDFLMQEYGKKGVNVDALVREQQAKANRNKRHLTYDEAFEEVVADSMEMMLADGNVIKRLEKLKAQDKDLWYKIKSFIDELAAKIKAAYKGMSPDSVEGRHVADMGKAIYRLQELFTEGLMDASDNFQSAMESVVEADAKAVDENEIITDGAVVTDGAGKKYSLRSMKEDIAEGQMFEDLKTYCGWTQKQVNELRNNLADLVEYMTPYRDILDMNETYGREGRRFSPYKPNSDPLYKISMDFSTLCSKRLLTQYVIENLQLRENRPMSAEEQMAIRAMLNEYRKVEKGLQVACAMCYVEAARLKSPKQITKWMEDPGTQMKNYFADKNPEFANFIKEKQADFKESRGYDRNATKKDMSPKDVRELNNIRPRLRSQYQLSAEEAEIIERVKSLPGSTYLTAGNLASLSETDPTIYAAYTAFVRTATRSKSLETDEPYYYGDSRRDNGNGIIVSDSFIEAVNRENGMRFSSWSDWRIQHLLDYITAVIDNSVRGAAMHGYTKFGEEVRVLGKTGMMFNMSGVAGTQTGLNEDGSLSFSPTESIDVNEAIQLREEFPDTAGLQCIGVGDDHIIALLRSDIIDYVIPYHVSGLNAGLRAMANIHGWKDYTSTQHAAIDKSIKFENAVDQEHWHEEPVYSEFFVGYDTGMTGIEAMRASSDRYVQMCKDRGLKPKFEQFVNEDNYWKLLIDRKMVNQKTGKLIQQKPVTPTFDFDTVKSVVDQFVENYDSGLEARALNHIVENWDSIPKRIRDLKKQGSTKAKKASKAVDTLANQTLAAQPTVKQSARDEAIELSDVNTKFSLREEAPPRRTIKAYKVFRVSEDGKLYPPKIANLTDDESLNKPLSKDKRKGKNRVVATGNDTPVGVWINADVGGITVDENGDAMLNTHGRIKVYDLNGMKADGSFNENTTLAFRPGWHLGSIPEAIQFLHKDGTMPDDLVYAECEIAADIDYQAAAMSYGVRVTGKFVHADAGLPAVPVDGYYKYKTNPKTDTHPWFISGAIKVNRIIGDAERRAICAKEGITIAPRYGGKDIEPTDIWPGGQPAVAKDLTPYKKSQKNFENEKLLARTLEKIKAMSAEDPTKGYIQREIDFNSKGIIDEIEKAKLDVDALRSAYEKHGYNPYYFDTDEEVKYSDRDSDGNSLTEEQSAFFAHSKVRDAEGNLMVMYHGTANGGSFTVFDGDKLGNDARTSQVGQGFYFTNMKAEAEAYKHNVDAYGRVSKGKNPHLHQVYLNITNPFNIDSDTLNIEKVKSVYMDGTYDYFFSDYIPFYLNKKTMNGRTFTKPELQAMSKADKVSVYVDYLTSFGSSDYAKAKEVLSNMVRAFPYGKQSELLTSMKNRLGYDGIVEEFKPGQYQYVAFSAEQIKAIDNQNPTSDPDIRYSDRDNEPTFYSHMAKVVDGVKQEKLGAASVVSMLRGKGVKAEEIKWSGIEAFLEGKKSVTKSELQEFIAGSMLQIEEETLDYKERPYTEDQQKRLDEYEAKRNEVVRRVADEWKRVTGEEFPIQNAGYDLESTVARKIIDTNLEHKRTSFEGRLLEKLRKDLQQISENNDDFGFDSWRDALRSIYRHRKDFIKHYEMSANEKAVIVKFCNALDAQNALPPKISEEDSDRLRTIARETAPWDRKIMEVKHEYNEEAAKHMPKWGSSRYNLKGGENYREILFRIPESNYTNEAMFTHWDDRSGILAHARIQDFNTFIGKMLFVEELQSDWHNDGHKDGYASEEQTVRKKIADLWNQWDALFEESINASATSVYSINEKMDKIEAERERLEKKVESGQLAPDAPFSDTYHEYVMKRLIRMAAEEGYDSIGWTPAQIQVERWSKKFAEGYRIEYDQDIPKFLNKYGKKWGTRVGKTVLDNGTEVWSMAITDSMKDSVLTEGQPLYSDRDVDSVSNRSLLANAFESVAQNDIERQKLQDYKGKIALINAEERKLQDLNQQIKDLSFAKGPKDTKAIRDLQFQATQTANRISTYDKQLLTLEASKPLQNVLQREKKMAYQRAEKKGKEALEAYREKTMKTQRELIEKWQDSRKKGIESRQKTAMRHKIKDVVNELNQYLLRGTKDRHVPIELQKAVAEALDAVNMDTVGADERIAKLEAEMLKAKTPEKIQEISRKIDHIREMGDRMNGRLRKLKDAYDQFVNSDDPMSANSHDDVISNKLQAVIESVGDTPLRDMSIAQLEDVYDMYRMVLTTIRNTNKAFKAKKSESISIIANQVMEEVEKVGGKKKLSRKGTEVIKSFIWNNLKPVYAFEHIGSDHFTEVFNNVRAGEDVWAVDVTEAREFYLDKSKKHGYDSWDFKKRYRFTSSSGMDFDLNLEQIMSLYAYSKREQAADHLKRGGIVIDETTEITVKNKLGIPVKFNPTEATAYNISDATLAEIISKLTADQKDFVDVMQDYLSTVMGAKGNEVSLEMYGVKLFKEKFYFPLKSAQQFMAKAKEQQKGEVKIKNSGFSKETVQKASNPIVLTPFMNVWADHVNEMSMYHAFVLPMEDFYRVYNYKTPTSDTMATESVEMFIQNAYGKGATKYIDQLLKDLNGGARTDHTTGIINKMMGLFKKGAVFASLSVVVQQPSAIARAAALVDIKHFIGPKVDHKRHALLWDEVKQYAPVAVIKEMGYFDTNMGKSTQDFILGKEYSGFSEKMKALFTDSGYRDEALSKAPALADEIAWCSIWEAVKRETKANYPGLDAKGEPFLMLCGSRFTEVIVKTQVYDSVLSRSGLMRSKDTGMKMATAFMAEPTTSINMITDALLKGKRGNRKYARGAIGAVIASQILNSILVSFVYAGRDDDEDETYWEKYIGTLTGQTLDSLNPAGYIPFIKDIMSIVKGYDVERSDMAVISDLWKAYENLSKDYISPYRKVEGFAGSIAQIFGLPVKNIMRDVRGIYQTIDSFVNGQQTTKAGIGYAVKGAITGKTVSNDQQLYEAILSGDQAQIARVKGRFEDQTAINNAIRKGLRENDSRIYEAALAQINGHPEERVKLQREVIADGFTQDDVVIATNAIITKLSPSTSTSEPKKKGLYDTEDFALFVASGKSSLANEAKQDIIATHQINGKTADEAEKSFQNSAKTDLKEMLLAGTVTAAAAEHALKTYCGMDAEEAKTQVNEWTYFKNTGVDYSDKKEKYLAGELSASELVKALTTVEGKTEDEAAKTVVTYTRDAYEDGLFNRSKAADIMVTYGGLTAEEAEAKLQYIDVKKQLPDTFVDDAWVDEYYEEVESSGITIEVFVDYRNQVKSITGEGKKERRMAVINSMPISSAQKDALYYAEGWAASKLYEAPWR